MATAIAHQLNILECWKQVEVLSFTQNYSFVSKNLNYMSWPRPFNAIFPQKCSFCVQHCMSFLILVFVIFFHLDWKLNVYLHDLVIFAPSKRGDVKLEPWTAIKNVPKVWIKNAPNTTCYLRVHGWWADRRLRPKNSLREAHLGSVKAHSLSHSLTRPLTCLSRAADAFYDFSARSK